ncbi:protamine-like protein [Xenentodon cancila]
MSCPVIAMSAASPAKSPKKRAKSQKKKTVSDLILKAVSASSQRGGVSLAALKKVLKAGGYDVVKNKVRILSAIKRLVTKKALLQSKGSFKINKKPPTPRKKKVVKKKKPKAKKTSVKKKAAKKSPKKKRKAKSPKKAKKPAATKKAKKPKSPKKPKRRAAKRTRAAAKK